MEKFIVYPAIDLRYGKVVRLHQGKADQQTVYGDDPEKTAQQWIDQGAEWLHVVNLNGAFGEVTAANENAIQMIASVGENRVKIQMGGGIRTLEQIESALALGVTRVVLGTAVIENPTFGTTVLSVFGGESIVFGLDALDGELMSQGWQTRSGKNLLTVAEELTDAGAKTIVYTNIKKDGMQTGVDLEVTKTLAHETGLDMIASGGTATLEDVAKVKEAGMAGVIVGRALYEGNFTLKEALNVR